MSVTALTKAAKIRACVYDATIGQGAHPYFNADDILYPIPKINHRLVNIAILSSINLLQQSDPVLTPNVMQGEMLFISEEPTLFVVIIAAKNKLFNV